VGVGAARRDREDWPMTEENKAVEVSRRIEAPAARIFEILADPRRHMDFDGSDMVRAAVDSRPISDIGDTFSMQMHRLGRDYLMINYVVEFEPDRRIVWEPAPGDVATAGDPSKIGVPAGYRWGYTLAPDGEDATIVTEVFDCGPEENGQILVGDGGQWINGSNTVVESMAATLERLEKISTE
jgi:uncharacterized protein YndB with AHSA1/START domain